MLAGINYSCIFRMVPYYFCYSFILLLNPQKIQVRRKNIRFYEKRDENFSCNTKIKNKQTFDQSAQGKINE